MAEYIKVAAQAPTWLRAGLLTVGLFGSNVLGCYLMHVHAIQSLQIGGMHTVTLGPLPLLVVQKTATLGSGFVMTIAPKSGMWLLLGLCVLGAVTMSIIGAKRVVR